MRTAITIAVINYHFDKRTEGSVGAVEMSLFLALVLIAFVEDIQSITT